MRVRRRLGVVGLMVLAACTPAPSPRPPVTPPPPPASIDLRLDWATDVEVPAAPGSSLRAVTAGPRGFVAVGSRSRGPRVEPVVLASVDGLRWRQARLDGRLRDVELTDVAADRNVAVAVGSRLIGDALTGSAFLVSVDDGPLRLLESAAYAGIEAYVQWVVAGDDGFLAGGVRADESAAPVAWSSIDGLTWRPLDDPPALSDVGWSGQGWIAAGREGGAPAIWRSEDASTWSFALLESGSAEAEVALDARRVVTGEAGAAAIGAVGPPCSPLASCPAEVRGWWSANDGEWRLVPREAWPFAGPVVLGADPGTGLLVAADGKGLSVSPDGWHWARVLDGEIPVSGEGDIAIARDVVVMVGESFAGNRPRAEVVVALAAAG